MTEQTSVIDLVSEPRYQAMFALRTLFESEELLELEQWVPVVLAMMQLPPQIMREVGIGIIERFFEEEALDPKDINDQKRAANFVPVLANSIHTAAQVIFQQMQQEAARQNQSRAKLANGLLGT